MKMTYTKRFLTAKECAEYLGINITTLYTMCNKRRIRFFKPNGGHTYFEVSDIENYISSGAIFEVRGQSEPPFE